MSNNYQLYRTNRRLTGQVKWDLTVEAHDSHLYVNDFHLSPISKQISMVKNPDENLLGNTHLVNLKSYYKKNKAIFWNPGLNPGISSCEPMLIPDNYGDHKSLNVTPYEESYMMGLSRSKYSYTGKQFEFFCPVWVEDYNSESPIAFKFVLKLASGGNPDIMQELVTKFLILKPGNYGNHNKFVGYIDDYFNATKPGDLININLKERTAQIKGINVETGLPVSSIEIPTLATNMLSQERLLMDADELIISSFERNNLIAPQLINFNFIFDAEELIPPSLLTAMWGGNIYIDVCAGVMDHTVNKNPFKQFDMMDFYSNYDFIQSKPSGLGISDDCNINIFDTLKDQHNIGLMDKNKVGQDIIHWSISGCNDYIFNMYPGFGGYTINNIIYTEKTPSITGSFTGDLYKWESNVFYGVGEDLTTKKISWSSLEVYRNLIREHDKWDNNPQCYIAEYGELKNIEGIELDESPDIKDNELVIIKPGLHQDFTMYYAGPLEECVGHITELYQDSPDLWTKKYEYAPTCINWCKNLYISSPVALIEYFNRMILDTNEYSYLFDEWSCNTRYTYINKKLAGVKGCLMVLPDNISSDILQAVESYPVIKFESLGSINEQVYVYYSESYDIVLFFVSEKSLNDAAFRSIRGWASDYKGEGFLREFARWISSVDEPGAYSLKQLNYTQAHGPSKVISELEHYKVNRTSIIFRYDGKIKPTFVKPDVNNIYIKKQLKMADMLEQFPKTYQSYKKLYKSIGYYPWENVDLKLNKTNGRDIILDLPNMPYEYKWYTTSTVLLLRSQLSFNINSDDISSDIETTVIEHLSRIYKVDPDTANYIYKKYDCRIDWEYQNDITLDKYIYTITLTLK